MTGRITLLVLLTAAPLTARAGVYNTEEPHNPLIAKAGEAPLEFADLKALRDGHRDPRTGKEGNERKQHYLRRAAELQGKVFAGTATVEDKINLSAYLIGLGKYQEAANLLEPEARGAQGRNAFLLANLATAYFGTRLLERAFDYQQLALDVWPEQAPGYTPEQLKWLKNVETRFRALILERRKEEANRVTDVSAPDNIFGVRFVGPDGQYTPGKLPEGQQLPADALAVTQQLVLWLPFEDRVYWLLAEVLNAQGQQRDALAVFSELIGAGYNAAQMKRHRTLIQEAQPVAEPPPLLTLSPRVIAVLAVAVALGLLFVFLQVREFRKRQRQAVKVGQDSGPDPGSSQ